jgi:hypothetical protein
MANSNSSYHLRNTCRAMYKELSRSVEQRLLQTLPGHPPDENSPSLPPYILPAPPQEKAHPVDKPTLLQDRAARDILFPLGLDEPLNNSDNSYVMSLCMKETHSDSPVNLYTYRSELPEGYVFVDQVGWVPGNESIRYLLMGYRVWVASGHRLYLHGRPSWFASLAPFRCFMSQIVICSQSLKEYPDLYSQRISSKPECACSTSVQAATGQTQSSLLPWSYRLQPVDISGDRLNGLNNLERAMLLFDATRVEVAQPCYSQERNMSWGVFGSQKLESWPLKRPTKNKLIVKLSDQLPGVDTDYLWIKYPSTKVTVKPLGTENEPSTADEHRHEKNRESTTSLTNRPGDKERNSSLCKRCQIIDFEELFEWGLEDFALEIGSCDEISAREDCSFCRLLFVLCRESLDFLKRWEDINPPPISPYGIPLDNMDAHAPFQLWVFRDPYRNSQTKPMLMLKQGRLHVKKFGPLVSLRTVRGDIRGNYTLQVSQYLNFEIITKMLSSCEMEHGGSCGIKSQSERQSQGFVLVDVKRRCLVQNDESGSRYIALSYVWGSDLMFTTSQQNFNDLKVEGALDNVGICQVILTLWRLQEVLLSSTYGLIPCV